MLAGALGRPPGAATFCQRQNISVGRMETIKTLKSPKPLYQMMAVGHDAQTVAKWQGAR